GQRRQQQREEQADDQSEPADGSVHRTLTASVSSSAAGSGRAAGAGRRAWSLIRNSRATIDQLASSDEPPCDRKGMVRPVSGISRVTPPTTTKHCSATENASPAARSLPKPSR